MPTMLLPVQLTNDDRLVISADLTVVIKSIEDVKAQKKAATKQYTDVIKDHEKTQHSLNENLRLGTIDREVEITEEKDWATGVTHIRRLDTGAIVKTQAIDPDERQTVMGLPGAGSTLVGVDGARTDEQREASTPEEAEALREERLANERAERISEAVSEARGRLSVLPVEVDNDVEPARFRATVQFGNHVVDEIGFSEAQAVEAAVRTITEFAEADEAARPAPTPTWDEVKAASEAEQRRQEVERLAAEQAADDKANKPKRLLQVPKGARKPKAEKKIKILDAEDNDLNAAPEEEPPASPVAADEAAAPGADAPSDEDGADLWT